jgi:hypothetical protein
MIRSKTPRLTPPTHRPNASNGSPAIVDGLYADACWPDSAGNTRCVLCGKAIVNKYIARSTHARVHVANGEVWQHRDVLGRTLWFPKDRL